MKRLSPRQRIVIGFAAIGLTIVILGIFAFTRWNTISDSARLITTDSVPGVAISTRIEVLAYRESALIENHISTGGDKSSQLGIDAQIQADTAQTDALLKQFGELVTTDVERRLLGQVRAARATYLAAIQQSLWGSASAKHLSLQPEVPDAQQLSFKGYTEALHELTEHNLREANDAGRGIQPALSPQRGRLSSRAL